MSTCGSRVTEKMKFMRICLVCASLVVVGIAVTSLRLDGCCHPIALLKQTANQSNFADVLYTLNTETESDDEPQSVAQETDTKRSIVTVATVIVTQTTRDYLRHNMSTNRNLETTTATSPDNCQNVEARRVVFIRHGQRLFRTVKWDDWLKSSFNKGGKYKPKIPLIHALPKRPGDMIIHKKDPPLHISGYQQSYDLGLVYKKLNITFSHVYTSNSLRCLETTQAMLEAMESDALINVEPGLHERSMSNFSNYLTLKEMKLNGFHVNSSFVSNLTDFEWEEVLPMHKRIYTVVNNIINRHKHQGGNIMIMGHANTGEMNARLLSGQGVPGYEDPFVYIVQKCRIPFLASTIIKETCDSGDSEYEWEREDITGLHGNYTYDWTCMDQRLQPGDKLYVLANGTWTL